jgi:soluble calcium-activated nucleotidase 1
VPLPSGSGWQFELAVVTDLDQDSRLPDGKNWRSFLKRGRLLVQDHEGNVRAEWAADAVELHSQLAAGGRSMELSDLVVFDGRLLTVDDRTGFFFFFLCLLLVLDVK